MSFIAQLRVLDPPSECTDVRLECSELLAGVQRRLVLIKGNNFYDVEEDAVRAKKASKTPLVSEIQTSTV